MKILFFDIDGVLNDHKWNDVAKSCSIKKECVEEFNRIIHETDCKLVISSAWRYMIIGASMTLKGFEYMLRTHGCTQKMDILDMTPSDEDITHRADQIRAWIDNHSDIDRWVAVDDLKLDLGDNFVQTDEKVGLTAELADEIIRKLNV